uniref:Myb-like domain-containing protein n=1 Tax=Brassica oleracea var. oleracea TaxID=109376 RepID=A0A0D3ACG8_BRAOL
MIYVYSVMVGCDQCVDPSLPYINRVSSLPTLSPHFFSLSLPCSNRVLLFPLFFSLFLELTSDMDSYPSTQSSKFVELFHSQQSISFGNYEDSVSLSSSQPLFQRTIVTEDGAFWTRVAAYFAASPPVAGCEQRESSHCKQRWHKINDLVCKFCGAYEAATREKSSGQNDNDILKLAHQFFYNNHIKETHWNTLGRSSGTTRSGATLLLLKTMGPLRRGSVMAVLIRQALKLLRTSVQRVLRPQRLAVRRHWQRRMR